MRVKSPSKYFSLKKLIQLKKDNFVSNSGIEYVACEVEELISQKTIGQWSDQGQKLWKNHHKIPEPNFQDLRKSMQDWHSTWIVPF